MQSSTEYSIPYHTRNALGSLCCINVRQQFVNDKVAESAV